MTHSPIFKIIKDAGRPLTFGEIYKAYPSTTLEEELVGLIVEGWLRRLPEGKYWPKRYLEPPMKAADREPQPGYYEYETIQKGAKEQKTGRFYSPFKKYFPKLWAQGDRGTCVGHASAIFAQSNYLALTGDYPTDAEIAEAKPDQEEDIGCKLVYDKWYHTIFSPQYIYETSRIIGNVTYPSGSFCSAAVKALKRWGAVTWERCLTSKSVFCAPKFHPLTRAELEPLAADHKIDGYATVTTFQSVMDAIDQNHAHCVLMPINVEYDYMNPTSDGLWRVHPGRAKAGSHALPWIAVDWDRRWIGCWNSWGDAVPQITWIDEAYYKENAGPGFVSLDKSEVKIAREKYARLIMDANVPATFWLDGEDLAGQPATAMVEKDMGYAVGAMEKSTGKTINQIIEVGSDVDEVRVDFEFAGPAPTQPGWLVELLKKIAEMLAKWRR